MNTTPKSLRLQIAVFGRMNVGKSTFINTLCGQNVSITSAQPGTTTDTVEKAMELLPIGPVLFIDTAGIDDKSELGTLRVGKTKKVFQRADVVVVVVESEVWGEFEDYIAQNATERKLPFIVVINKVDLKAPSENFLKLIKEKSKNYITACSIDLEDREKLLEVFKSKIISICSADFLNPPPLISDLVGAGGLAVMVVPIDLQAPKGRLILPQVQTIREALDSDAMCLVVKERELSFALSSINIKPSIVVCDSQVVLKTLADVPKNIKCTTFSILFARLKGNLSEMARGAAALGKLKRGDKVLIAESCTHHALEDDIGRVKIPRWIKQYTGASVEIDHSCGMDYPENLSQYKLVVHCGGCMLNRVQMLSRIQQAHSSGVAITNYGLCISFVQGVIERVLEPFPDALEAYKSEFD
ncbi:MAG: [FeFe] hydrogenase H-cluster maturation GTPase HydF [Endomicrobiales bacterium]|nr:[FeFe] hydrogenase H-cluster maturation GTPase HydF [Endomicrobiales bacterium]